MRVNTQKYGPVAKKYVKIHFFGPPQLHFSLTGAIWSRPCINVHFQGVFGSGANHKVFGDFKELKENPDPAFFIHMIEKPAGRKITTQYHDQL